VHSNVEGCSYENGGTWVGDGTALAEESKAGGEKKRGEEKRAHRTKVKSPISCDILAYLADHPDAEDTLEGIGEWWILEQKIKSSVDDIRQALAELLTEELVIAQKLPGSRVVYRLNPRKADTIESLVKKRDST
jgi:hypothetical protein